MDDREYQKHLNERRAQSYESTRLWNADPDKIGMWGERVTAEFFGGEPDLRNRPEGDKGIDLEVLLNFDHEQWYEIDAKTARGPMNLLIDSRKEIPDARIYMLLAYNAVVPFRGWEFGSRIKRWPTHYWSGNDALVHYKSAHLLRPVSDLKVAYCGWWRHHGLEGHKAEYAAAETAAGPDVKEGLAQQREALGHIYPHLKTVNEEELLKRLGYLTAADKSMTR